MNKKTVFLSWGALFILCAGLGFIQEPEGALKVFLFLLSLIFFLPPALLVCRSLREKDKAALALLRNLSGLSLLLTMIFIVLNILSALWPRMAGDLLHYMLTIVSSPMMCCGNWFLSMFLWACLLMASLKGLKGLK